MNKRSILLILCAWISGTTLANSATDPRQAEEPSPRNVAIDSVVVTGTRYASDIRHLPMAVSVIGRRAIEQRREASLLPLLTEQVPGLFITSRGVMGYGVSTGASGGMSLRGWAAVRPHRCSS